MEEKSENIQHTMFDEFTFDFDEDFSITSSSSLPTESEESSTAINPPPPRSELERTIELLEQGTDVPTEDVIDVAKNADYKDLDALLAKSLNQMSMEDRDKLMSEVHGVAEAPAEEPDFVQERLEQMDQCISQISEKEAYDRALYLSPEYVQDPKFRLMFLRSRDYDPEQAAATITLHFEEKLKIFGMDNLVKDITMDDLHSGDMDALESGFKQICPFRDRAGRAVSGRKSISRSISEISTPHH